MSKILHWMLTTAIVGIALIMLVSFSYPKPNDCPEILNVWNKISTDELNPGEVIAMDMSKGYAYIEDGYIILMVQEVATDNGVMIAFPIGYWEAPKQDPFLEALNEEFDSLEKYLKQQKGKEIRKE